MESSSANCKFDVKQAKIAVKHAVCSNCDFSWIFHIDKRRNDIFPHHLFHSICITSVHPFVTLQQYCNFQWFSVWFTFFFIVTLLYCTVDRSFSIVGFRCLCVYTLIIVVIIEHVWNCRLLFVIVKIIFLLFCLSFCYQNWSEFQRFLGWV